MSPCAFNIAPRPSSPSVASTTLVSSVQFSPSVVSDSLHPQVLQHTRPPCPSPTPGVCPNSCPLKTWTTGNIQGTCKILLQHHSSKASMLWHSDFFIVQLSHPYMTTGKTIALTRWTFVGKVISLLFNMLFRLVIAFLPRSKCPSFMAAVTICSDFGAPQNKVCHCFHCFPIYWPWSDGLRCHDLGFLNVFSRIENNVWIKPLKAQWILRRHFKGEIIWTQS